MVWCKLPLLRNPHILLEPKNSSAIFSGPRSVRKAHSLTHSITSVVPQHFHYTVSMQPLQHNVSIISLNSSQAARHPRIATPHHNQNSVSQYRHHAPLKISTLFQSPTRSSYQASMFSPLATKVTLHPNLQQHLPTSTEAWHHYHMIKYSSTSSLPTLP